MVVICMELKGFSILDFLFSWEGCLAGSIEGKRGVPRVECVDPLMDALSSMWMELSKES